jgi:hypothetical protein
MVSGASASPPNFHICTAHATFYAGSCAGRPSFCANVTMQPADQLLRLPPEVASTVWDQIGVVDILSFPRERKSLWASSRRVQELLAPAITSLTLTLEDPEDTKPLRGLHPKVRLQRLTVESHGDGSVTVDYGVPSVACKSDTFSPVAEYASNNPMLASLQHLHIKVGDQPHVWYKSPASENYCDCWQFFVGTTCRSTS